MAAGAGGGGTGMGGMAASGAMGGPITIMTGGAGAGPGAPCAAEDFAPFLATLNLTRFGRFLALCSNLPPSLGLGWSRGVCSSKLRHLCLTGKLENS